MKFKNEMTCTAFRRALSGTQLCVRTRRGRAHTYVQPDPANPDSPQQQAVREGLGSLANAWNSLTPERKEEWRAAARRLVLDFPDCAGALNCYSLFTQCAVNCTILGEALPEAAPGYRRPGALTGIELLPTDDAARYTFRLEHGIRPGSCRRYRVITSVTPATPKLTHRPDASRLRLINGYCPASGSRLPASGGIILFTDAGITVAPGSRFGVSMRIVHLPEGLASEELFVDLERKGEG